MTCQTNSPTTSPSPLVELASWPVDSKRLRYYHEASSRGRDTQEIPPMMCRRILTLLCCCHLPTLYAAPVAVMNPGFEDPYLGGNLPPQYAGDVPATAFPVGAPPSGWAPFGGVGGTAFVGVLNPGVMAVEPLATYFPGGAPEGENVALTFFDGHQGGAEFGIQQTLSATLQPHSLHLDRGSGQYRLRCERRTAVRKFRFL